MNTQQTSAFQEWRTHWGLVLASFIGFSFHSLTTYSAGLFILPLSTEFGWSRAQATAGLSIAALASIPLGPVVGAIVDRWGVRIPAITGLALTACAVSLFSIASGSFTQWIALWTFYAIVATGIKSTVWTVAVTGTFTAARGLALGFVMCGAAAAQIVTPPLTRWLIDSQGWRFAYIWMGLGWGSIALLAAIFLFFDARAKKERMAKAVEARKLSAADFPGLGFREAMGNPALICVAISTVITMFMGIALIVHQVPILTELGVSRSNAAYLASLSGVAGIAGKLGTGWMSDRWDARLIGGITLAVPAFAFILLLEPIRTPFLIVLAMIIIGYSSGAKLQISAYLTSRYVGMRNFGKVFGVIGGLIAAGTGLGPVTAAWTFDHYGGYMPFILLGIPISLLCGVLIARLPPFPDWTVSTA
ncbi:MFS transporter [Sphingobium aromaticiconvertens]|uniref:MFS transporter n=1 Tax=Sphingobium aromaticiconvertens TaxID=365341 RepID=UPI003018F92E